MRPCFNLKGPPRKAAGGQVRSPDITPPWRSDVFNLTPGAVRTVAPPWLKKGRGRVHAQLEMCRSRLGVILGPLNKRI